MLRWTRRLLTLFSFLLLGQSLALWARSYVITDLINHQTVSRSASTLVHNHRMLASDRGQLGFMIKRSTWSLPHPEVQEEQVAAFPQGFSHESLTGVTASPLGMQKAPRFGFGGEKIATTSEGTSAHGRIIVFPWWVPALMFAILPVVGVVRFLAARRRVKRLKALNWNGMQTRKLAA
jgi:hypothetical protein